MGTDTQLIVAAAAGIALILFLIIRTKLHAFVSLLLGSLVIGVAAGMPFQSVIDSVATGVGSTLASIAVVVGLGAMFGRMLEVSGGAEALAQGLLEKAGERNAQWSLLAVGFIVAIPVFFDVAFIVLVSVIYGLTEKTGRPIVYYAVPLMAGLVITHSFIPPTPGPIAVAGLLGADLGFVMLFGALIGIPAAIVAGPVFGTFIAARVPAGMPDYMQVPERPAGRALPPVRLIVTLIAIPLVLIVGNTVAGVALEEENRVRSVLALVGHPMVALLTAAGLVAALFGDAELGEAMLALHVIAIAAGATIASHVNDSGFWLVNRYLGLTVPETFKTWTALTTIASLVAIVLVLIVAALL